MSAADPEASLLMAAYRPRPDWLRIAVEAALAETEVELELVVVDDGSPEPVAELLSWCRDPRLRVVRAEHRGLAATRTRGLEEARAPYVRFIDADDAVPLGSTPALLRMAGGREDLIAYGWTVVCDEELRPRWTMRSAVAGDARLACVTGGLTVRVHAMLIPRTVAERAVWDADNPVAEDWDYTLQLLEHAEVAPGEFPASYYRRHGGGQTAQVDRGAEAAARVRERYLARHPEHRGTAVERRAKAFMHAQAARAYATRGSVGRAVGHGTRAATLSPPILLREIGRGISALRSFRAS